jgi:hypothetical protein
MMVLEINLFDAVSGAGFIEVGLAFQKGTIAPN